MWLTALSFLKGVSLKTWLVIGAFVAVGIWHWNGVRVARNEGRAEIQVKLDAAQAQIVTLVATVNGHVATIKAQSASLDDCIGQRTAVAAIADAALDEAKRANKELNAKLTARMDRLAAAKVAVPECAALREMDLDAVCGL